VEDATTATKDTDALCILPLAKVDKKQIMARLVVLAFVLMASAFAFNKARFEHQSARGLPPVITNAPETIVQHHSFFPPLLSDFAMGQSSLAHWSFGLSTVVTDEYVRLTPSKQSREGYFWNDVALQVPTWTAYLGFRVHATANLGGDGFALWLAERPSTSGGPVVGTRAAGFKGIGIIFDSFDNDHQRDNPAVHILNQLDRPASETDLDPGTDYRDSRVGTCTFDFRNSQPGEIINAMISYEPSKKLAIVLESKKQSQTCAIIDNVEIPAGYYFGFSAHTGGVADNHDIHWFIVTSEDVGPQAPTSDLPGANDAEGVDRRVAAIEKRGVAHPEFDHQKDAREKLRWQAQPPQP
jgi:hypothetical protein